MIGETSSVVKGLLQYSEKPMRIDSRACLPYFPVRKGKQVLKEGERHDIKYHCRFQQIVTNSYGKCSVGQQVDDIVYHQDKAAGQ